jgi:hypothetical protein
MPTKKPTLDSVVRLPAVSENKLKGPSSPEEAREWLEAAARHLSEWPNASRRFRFVGYALAAALKRGAHDKESLLHALRLIPSTGAKRRRGNQPVSLESVRGIAKMLGKKASIPDILKSFDVSKTTIDRVRTEYRALTCNVPESWRDEDGGVRKDQWKKILRRARNIDPPEWADPIILGLCDAIAEGGAGEILDPIDPANPFAPLPVDPDHKPELVRSTRRNP